MKVYFVLPAYNEESSLKPLIEEIYESFTEPVRKYEIIIVNDGSKDNTLQVAQDLSQKYPVDIVDNKVNMGLAKTLKRGLLHVLSKASKEDVVVVMDADNTHPPGLSLRMIQLIREGNDVVIASRYQKGSYIQGLTLFRRFLSYGASWLFRVTFPMRGVRDYTCGYRVYKTGALKALQDKYGDELTDQKGFSCMVDVLLKLRTLNLLFAEVPLILKYDMKEGESKMEVGKTVGETLMLIFKTRLGLNKK